jgi:hypothetical protein
MPTMSTSVRKAVKVPVGTYIAANHSLPRCGFVELERSGHHVDLRAVALEPEGHVDACGPRVEGDHWSGDA